MERRKAIMSLSGFPPEAENYEIISTYSSSATFSAPETGWFMIEVFGASGHGGAGAYKNMGDAYSFAGGGGGGGGGYACSKIKMKKGDTAVLSPGSVGNTSSAVINSSAESYSDITVTSGKNGGVGGINSNNYTGYGGGGGAGGTASGGNFHNANGKNGGGGSFGYTGVYGTEGSGNGGAGGTPGYTGGNTGGHGANATYLNAGSPTYGRAGFIKIYRGDTN